MKQAFVVAAVVAACAGGAASATPASDAPAPTVTAKRCKAGLRHGVIAGRHVCLRAGQRCRRKRDRSYHRYGFHCHTGRLARVRPTRPAPPPPPPPPGSALNAIRIKVPGTPDRAKIRDGFVWLTGHREHAVFRIDPATNRVTEIRVPDYGPGDVELAAGSLWVGHCQGDFEGALVRVDPQTHAVLARFAGLATCAVAYGADSIWAFDRKRNQVLRIDPAANAVVASIPVERPLRMTFGFGSVWIAREDGSVSRVDPATNTVTATIPVGGPEAFIGGDLVAGEGSIWMPTVRYLYRIDPATNAATPIDVGIERSAGLWGAGVAVAPGVVWVKTSTSTFARLDPATNSVVERLDVGRPTPLSTPYAAGKPGLGFGALWIPIPESNEVWRIPRP